MDTRRRFTLSDQLRRKYFGICQFSLRDLTVQHGRHHPCWKVPHFLPCTRPPDVDLLNLRSYFLSQIGPHYVRMLKLPMSSSSEGHILSDPGLLACLFPTQCIARYTEGLYEVQVNTNHARASEPSLAQSLMRLLAAVAVRNLRSSVPFPSTRWSTA